MIRQISYLNCLFYFSSFIIFYSILRFFSYEIESIEKILYFLIPFTLFFPFFNKRYKNLLLFFIFLGIVIFFTINILNLFYLIFIYIILFFINYFNFFFNIQKLKFLESLLISILFLFSFKIIF